MPGRLVVEPDELRRIAMQHDLAAAKLRKWGEIPHAWLAEFKDTYGTIADPMRGALIDYYDRRHARAERLAVNHEETRDQLLAAARALEESDQAGGRQVSHAGGDDHTSHPGGPHAYPAAPVHTSPDASDVHGNQPWRPAPTTSDAPRMPDETVRSDPAPLSPAASGPPSVAPTYGTALAGISVPTESAPNGTGSSLAGMSEPVAAGIPASPSVDANGATATAGATVAPMVPGSFPAAAAGATGGIRGSSATARFAAAVQETKDKHALPSFKAGTPVDDDLAVARTLLAAILAAVGNSAPGLEWAVAAARTSNGPVVVLTSTEGRGWLPPGLFLPLWVTLPWRREFVIDAGDRGVVAALESSADPARILAEFGLLAAQTGNLRISALVSSAAIPDNLRATLGDDVAVEGLVSAADSAVDLTSPGVGLVDRLALAGSTTSRQRAVTVPEAEIRATCLELARVADAQVRTAVPARSGEISAHRARRQQILDALHAGWAVPASLWDQIRAADDMRAALLRSQQIDLSNLPIGVTPAASGAEALRALVFERRADELLLLLAAGEADRQTLRDAFYAYDQLVEHPLFQAASRAVGAQTTDTHVQVSGVVVPSGSISVSSAVLGGAPPSIAELLNGPAGAGRSSEQRRA